MLKTLALKEYRSFGSYKLERLAPVNLLVGRNNSGKTSVLEAVHLLVSKGDPFVLAQSASRRDEHSFFNIYKTNRGLRTRGLFDISHLFRGHAFRLGANFTIFGDSHYGHIRVAVEDDRNGDLDRQQRSLFDEELVTRPYALTIQGSMRERLVLPVTTNGLFGPQYSPAGLASGDVSPVSPPVQFVTAESLKTESMQPMWDNVLIEGREPEVVNAMKLLDPELKSIHFLSHSHKQRYSAAGGIVLGFGTGSRRVPIGSHGEGTRRLLALSLCLTQLHGGFLLIDEIDTGLHWTIMQDMWRFVVETALASSVQIFATTHSYDCIQGLKTLIESRPDLATGVSIQKMERSLDGAVSLDARSIVIAVEQDIEVR